jgi:hypothetical protein
MCVYFRQRQIMHPPRKTLQAHGVWDASRQPNKEDGDQACPSNEPNMFRCVRLRPTCSCCLGYGTEAPGEPGPGAPGPGPTSFRTGFSISSGSSLVQRARIGFCEFQAPHLDLRPFPEKHQGSVDRGPDELGELTSLEAPNPKSETSPITPKRSGMWLRACRRRRDLETRRHSCPAGCKNLLGRVS